MPALLLIGGALLPGIAGCHRTPGADVVATVNGKEILRSDLERLYKASLSNNPQQPSPVEANIRRLSILHGLIDDEILQQRAAKLNLAATDDDVNAKLTEYKAPYTEEEFDKQLKARNLTLDDFKRDIRRSLTKEKLLNKEIESKINITDSQITAFYNQHKSEFNVVEPQYHLAEIAVTTAPAQQTSNLQNNKASGEADAKKKIDTLHNRLESGDDFGSLAMNFSEDSNTASNGGDVGFIPESQLRTEPEVFDAVSKLKPDQFTDVLPVYNNGTSHKIIGYVIYKLIAREPAGQRELNDPNVQQTIHQTLHEGQKQLLQNAYFEMLQDDAKVRNYLAENILKNGGTE
ncbi:MAG TPA: SurA N-terminal domain-containing protein [Terracidiphilus sp.]|nr:SurA N-terminal domain-containing protein [Terracidiphilus sp.]